MSLSSKTRVAVLRGGPSPSYDYSLKSGEHVLSTLREMSDTYDPIDIFISRDGEWHYGGLIQEPYQALRHVDVVWNALNGSYGADGQVQKVLESLKIPFTGSSAVTSAFTANPEMTRRLYAQYGLLTPPHEVVSRKNFNENRLVSIFRKYLHPVVIRTMNIDSAQNMIHTKTFEELKRVIREALNYEPRVLVEEFMNGNEISCSVLEGARGEKLYALLPISRFDLPLKTEVNKQVEAMAKQAHSTLGLRHYSSSNFIVTSKGNIYILETSSLPSLHKDSPMQKSLSATGWRPREFVSHILSLVK